MYLTSVYIYICSIIHTYIAEDAVSFIEEELVKFVKKLDLIQRSEESGYEMVKEVSSLLSEVNLENITSEITEMTSDAFNSLDQTTTNCELADQRAKS